MGSNTHLKETAVTLRRKGMSYNNIRKTLGIKSKGTLSHWFKNLELSNKSIKLLEENNKLAHERGLHKANKDRSNRIKIENKKAFLEGLDCVKSISEKELMLIGTALYWGEGSKSERMTSTPLDFSNSDPRMVIVYMKFLRKILKIPEERIRAGIHLYPSTPIDKARKFWAITTNLPEKRFFIINQISRASQNKRPFNTLPYGTIAIKISSRIQFHKVKGMIEGIMQKLT
ncbi:MAG TPA: hypothetical protein VI775_00745 [Candidatus Paceibacterota bacterium]